MRVPKEKNYLLSCVQCCHVEQCAHSTQCEVFEANGMNLTSQVLIIFLPDQIFHLHYFSIPIIGCRVSWTVGQSIAISYLMEAVQHFF